VLPSRSLAVGAGTALTLAVIAFSNGGYFPTAWGWGALLALCLVAVYLVVGEPVRPGLPALVLFGSLAALAGWTWLSLAWSEDVSSSALEGQRMLLYVAAGAAFVLLVRRTTVPYVVAGALVAVVSVAGYGLASRLFPERLGVYEPTSGYRLTEPLGYWNGLGLFAAMGVLLALGFVARGRSMPTRALAAATLPVLAATIYFTFSRGAWIAAGVGLVAAVALDPRRLQLLAAALALAPASALAVLLSSQQDALTRTDAPLSAASREGHRLALYLLVLVAVSAAVGAALAIIEPKLRPSRTLRAGFAGGLAVVVVAALGVVLVRYGGPVDLVDKGYDSFTKTSPPKEANLNRRLFSFSGSYRAELWEAAWDDYTANPLLGSGPGTYEQYWNRHRPIRHIVRDAHSLYLEVLAELGPVGLLLLALALAAPFVGAVRARRHPLVPLALAAYVAFLVHAAVDWDWELTAVTLVALAVGTALLAAAEPDDLARPLGLPTRAAAAGAAIALSGVAFVGLVGASALAESERALDKGRYDKADSEARKASRWWRWSSEPWRMLGDVQAAAGDLPAARTSYRKAIDKDRRDWLLWYQLSSVSEGAEARRALAEATRLNPFYRTDLEAESAPA
jgi:tetratricopeptide (TPR) repeat protein